MTRARSELSGLLLATLVALSAVLATVTLAGTAAAASPTAAVEYDAGTIEVVLDAPATVSPADVEVTVDGATRRVTSVAGNGSRTITLHVGSDVRPVDDATVRFTGDVDGAVAVRATGATVSLADGTVDPDPVRAGTPVAVVTASVDSAFDVFANGSRVTTRGTGRYSRVFVFDSSGVGHDVEYRFETGGGSGATVTFVGLDLDVSAPSTVPVGEQFTVTATTDGDRDVRFRLVGGGSVVDSATTSTGADGVASATLTAPATAGNYTVQAVDANSGVSATSDVVAATAADAPPETATVVGIATATRTDTPTATPTDPPPETGDGGIPGFGAGVAAVALLGAALLAARRRR